MLCTYELEGPLKIEWFSDKNILLADAIAKAQHRQGTGIGLATKSGESELLGFVSRSSGQFVFYGGKYVKGTPIINAAHEKHITLGEILTAEHAYKGGPDRLNLLGVIRYHLGQNILTPKVTSAILTGDTAFLATGHWTDKNSICVYDKRRMLEPGVIQKGDAPERLERFFMNYGRFPTKLEREGASPSAIVFKERTRLVKHLWTPVSKGIQIALGDGDFVYYASYDSSKGSRLGILHDWSAIHTESRGKALERMTTLIDIGAGLAPIESELGLSPNDLKIFWKCLGEFAKTNKNNLWLPSFEKTGRNSVHLVTDSATPDIQVIVARDYGGDPHGTQFTKPTILGYFAKSNTRACLGSMAINGEFPDRHTVETILGIKNEEKAPLPRRGLTR